MRTRRLLLLGGGIIILLPLAAIFLFGPWSRITTPIPITTKVLLPDYPNATDMNFWGSKARGREVYGGIEAIQLTQTTTFNTSDTPEEVMTFYRTYANQEQLTVEVPTHTTCCREITAPEQSTSELKLIRILMDQQAMQSGYMYIIRILPTEAVNRRRVEIRQQPWVTEIFRPS